MIGKMNNNQIVNVLQSQLIGRLACYADKKLYLVPITYAYKDGYIYCHSKEGLKVEMMRKNPEVCFQVDDIENQNSWRCVILWGEYERLSKETEQENAKQILADRLEPISTGETVVPQIRQDVPSNFRIRIKEQSGRFEKGFA